MKCAHIMLLVLITLTATPALAQEEYEPLDFTVRVVPDCTAFQSMKVVDEAGTEEWYEVAVCTWEKYKGDKRVYRPEDGWHDVYVSNAYYLVVDFRWLNGNEPETYSVLLYDGERATGFWFVGDKVCFYLNTGRRVIYDYERGTWQRQEAVADE